MTVPKNQRGCCIRKNEIKEDLFLQRNGSWGAYRTRARFHSHNAAEKAAERHGIEVYGIF